MVYINIIKKKAQEIFMWSLIITNRMKLEWEIKSFFKEHFCTLIDELLL